MALLQRQVDALHAVVAHLPIGLDMHIVERHHTSNAFKRHALVETGGAEQGKDLVLHGKRSAQGEIVQLLFYVNL